MEIIYVDRLFCINLLADYLLCLLSARSCGLYLRRLRYLAAAMAGGLYSVAVLLPGLEFLSNPGGKLCCALIMGLIAFGGEGRPLRCTLVFLAISALFAGACWGVAMAAGLDSGGLYGALSLRATLLSFALCYAAASLFFSRSGSTRERQRLEICLELCGRESRFTALYDSGNSLTDPLSGRRVMIVSPDVLSPLLGSASPMLTEPDPVALLSKSGGDSTLRGRLRLIPYSSVGGGGMLAALRPDSVSVDGRRQQLLVAVSHKIGPGEAIF